MNHKGLITSSTARPIHSSPNAAQSAAPSPTQTVASMSAGSDRRRRLRHTKCPRCSPAVAGPVPGAEVDVAADVEEQRQDLEQPGQDP
jgi:hypothetical protein